MARGQVCQSTGFINGLHCGFAYSALASSRTGISGSASFMWFGGVFVGLQMENGAERSQAARPWLPATRSPSSNSMCFPSANSISFLAASKLGA